MTKSATKTELANKKFNKLPKNKQRVLIAKDVIAQIKKSRYKPRRLAWVQFSNKFRKKLQNAEMSSVAFQAALQQSFSCKCCALGACVVSKARLGNRIDPFKNSLHLGVKDEIFLDNEYDIQDELCSIFGKQFPIIELAFEKGDSSFNLDLDNGWVDSHYISKNAAISFGEKYKSDKTRLIGIMKNIIDNDGEFKP